MDSKKITDQMLIDILKEVYNPVFESFAFNMLLSRLKMQLKSNPPISFSVALAEIRKFFESSINLPSLQRDLEKLARYGQ